MADENTGFAPTHTRSHRETRAQTERYQFFDWSLLESSSLVDA
jgi:hypothetical protein